jgi:hypothetical protein
MYIDGLVSFGMLLAGVTRLAYPDEMFAERQRVYPELPSWTVYMIPIFEILTGFLVWTKYRNAALATWIVGVLVFMLSLMLRPSERRKVLDSYRDVFTVDSTFTSLTVHFLWIVIIASTVTKNL